LQIWKDVNGVATCDPRTIQNVRYIPELSFSAMGELSTLGAKVLHPMTLRPTIRKNIPVFMGNTFNPNAQGTWIKEVSWHRPLVQAMAIRENQTLVTFVSHQNLPANKFFAKVFDLLVRYRIPLDLVNTFENRMTFLIPPRMTLSEDLKRNLEPICKIETEEDLAMVSLIGHGIKHQKGFMTKLFAFLDDYSIRQLIFGTGQHGLSIILPQEKSNKILNLLHRNFIEDDDDFNQAGREL
jgi:aspartate kinase